MSLHLLDLRPIKHQPRSAIHKRPVSIAVIGDGMSLVVSRYGDAEWDFYPYFPQDNVPPSSKRINWRIPLPDGRQLTDPEHAGLLSSTKDFIWSLFIDPVEGRKRPTMATLRNKVIDITPLLRWMVQRGIRRFADLAGSTLDYVPVAKAGSGNRAIRANTAGKRLIIMEELFYQREKINDGLWTHPWPHETATALAGFTRAGGRKPQTELIPDTVAHQLSTTALDYIQNRSKSILTTVAAADAVGEKLLAAGYSRGTSSVARRLAARDAGFNGAKGLAAEALRLRTACYIVIAMFSGIRDSEMTSIAESCISAGKSKDGSTDVLWLHGTIYKTGVRPKKWLVPPVVEDAVAVLTKLTATLRDEMRKEEANLESSLCLAIGRERERLVKRLNTVRKQKDKLFLSQGQQGGEAAVLSSAGTTGSLRSFCANHDICDQSGRPYPLHSHQFRRTYARFVARAELGDLLTLRDHFGHWTIDMTTLYVDGGADEYEVDVELLEMVMAEKRNRQNEVMTNYLDSDSPLANGQHWLKEWRTTVRTAVNKEELIAEYAGTITLNGTGHSWCIGNVKGTGCGGLCVFEADMCVDCNFGMIGPEFLPIWKGIASQQEEVLAMPDLGIPGKARAQRILDKAYKVIAKLEAR